MIFQFTGLGKNCVISPRPNIDERGFFARTFCSELFESHGLNKTWVQSNISMSVYPGTLRGLHFQSAPHSEVKLIRCISGAIWDVVCDVRPSSDTFGKWYGARLDSINRKMMYVPEGFAHGFISMQPNSEIFYLVSSAYCPSAEKTLLWNDTTVSIKWPQLPSVISEKDKKGITLKNLLKYL